MSSRPDALKVYKPGGPRTTVRLSMLATPYLSAVASFPTTATSHAAAMRVCSSVSANAGLASASVDMEVRDLQHLTECAAMLLRLPAVRNVELEA